MDNKEVLLRCLKLMLIGYKIRNHNLDENGFDYTKEFFMETI